MAAPLISAAELQAALASADPPVLLDVRGGVFGAPARESYDAGHLPGAAFVDLDHDLAGPPGPGGRHPLPDVAVLEAAMRRAGVRSDAAVVVYDDGSGTVAARAWWLLRWAGHDVVRLLDGGVAAWRDAGGALETAEPVAAAGDFVAQAGAMPVLDAAGAAEVARTGTLIDVRAAERFRGETEPIDPVAGHIPGAINVPAADTVDDAGRLLPPEDLRPCYAGVTAPVGVYCGSGVTAAHGVLVLETLGVPAALYVGSWSDWITDPARPVATD